MRLNKIEVKAEEALLSLLLIAEILEFLNLLPYWMSVAEKALSISCIAYLFYKASITKILSGTRERYIDVLILAAFLLLSMKTIFSLLIGNEFIARNLFFVQNFELYSFYAGTIMLMILAIHIGVQEHKKPSIMTMIHEEKLKNRILRSITTYIALSAIYLTAFTFIFEWLGIAMDAATAVLLLVLYLTIIVQRGKDMPTESFIKNVGESAERFYYRFIGLFHYRKTVILGISGLIILHLIADFTSYVIPLSTGIYNEYVTGGINLGQAMANNFAFEATSLGKAAVILTYALNITAIVGICFLPAVAWAYQYRSKKIILRYTWLFLASIPAVLLAPILRIRMIENEGMIGAEALANGITSTNNLGYILLICFLVGAIFIVLSKFNKERESKIALLISFLFIAYYLSIYARSIASRYLSSISALFHNGMYFPAIQFIMYLLILMVFYVGGYILFAHRTFKQKV